MDFSPLTRIRGLFSPSAGAITAIVIGALGAVLMYVSVEKSLVVSIILLGVVPILVLIVLFPRVGSLLLVFSMCFIEEFPGGVSEEDTERSARTPFYGVTIGISALYIPDFMVLGMTALYFIYSLLYRNPIPFQLDKIGVGLLLMLAMVIISIVFSGVGAHPFGDPVLDLSLVGAVDLPEFIARMIAVLQFKLFLIIIPSYIIGLYFFREEKDVKQMIWVFGLAMLGTVLQAVVRIGLDPGMIRSMITVIYDTASVWFMAMAIFYFAGMWSCGKYNLSRSMLVGVFSVVMMALILLSFRRTMWGAIALALLFFPFILPKRSWGKLAMLTVIGVSFCLLILLITPIGHTILSTVIARLTETSLDNSSTLYRFAIFVWMVNNIGEIPLFGYGLEPLWNEVVRVRFFETSMENIHSFYYWILLRLGPIGTFVCTISLAMIFMRLKEVHTMMVKDEYRIIVGIVFLAVIMFLFSGIFNPTYGRVRFMVPLGLMLALVTRMPDIIANSQSK
jgi:O-antigen ligase